MRPQTPKSFQISLPLLLLLLPGNIQSFCDLYGVTVKIHDSPFCSGSSLKDPWFHFENPCWAVKITRSIQGVHILLPDVYFAISTCEWSTRVSLELVLVCVTALTQQTLSTYLRLSKVNLFTSNSCMFTAAILIDAQIAWVIVTTVYSAVAMKWWLLPVMHAVHVGCW